MIFREVDRLSSSLQHFVKSTAAYGTIIHLLDDILLGVGYDQGAHALLSLYIEINKELNVLLTHEIPKDPHRFWSWAASYWIQTEWKCVFREIKSNTWLETFGIWCQTSIVLKYMQSLIGSLSFYWRPILLRRPFYRRLTNALCCLCKPMHHIQWNYCYLPTLICVHFVIRLKDINIQRYPRIHRVSVWLSRFIQILRKGEFIKLYT